MISKKLEDIKEEDLQQLKDNAVPESKTIEYKRDLPKLNNVDEKRKFIFQVISFANTAGGDLIFGIEERKGIPKEVLGCKVDDQDKVISNLQNTIRSNTDPRIPGLDIQPITIKNGNLCFIMRIPRSWVSPHGATVDRSPPVFYARNSNGKHPMDVSELRVAFDLSGDLSERIKYFRADRLSKLQSNEAVIPLPEPPYIVFHIIPLISFRQGQYYEIDKVKKTLSTIVPGGDIARYNLDGIMKYASVLGKRYDSYVQLFHNGIIEAVDATIIDREFQEKTIPSQTFEVRLIEALSNYLSVLQGMNVELPIYVMVTIIGAKGYKMATSKAWWMNAVSIDRDIVISRENVIESYEKRPWEILKPCFDSIWNACGYRVSENYDEDGNWRGR